MVGNTKPQNIAVEVPWTELAAITTPFGGFLSRDGRRCDVAFFYDVITMSHPNCVSLLRRKLSWKQLVAVDGEQTMKLVRPLNPDPCSAKQPRVLSPTGIL